MDVIKDILIVFAGIIIAGAIICSAIYGEYALLNQLLEGEYEEWFIIIAALTFWALASMAVKIFGILFPHVGMVKCSKEKANRNIVSHISDSELEEGINNEMRLIPKPLGGYRREQLNEIYLLGIIIHQLYFSQINNNLSEKQQRESLNIQMRFFITVFPNYNIDDYFDFAESFMNKNADAYNLSVTECLDRSINILALCNNKQIRKLQKLYRTLSYSYIKIGNGDRDIMTTFVNMLDAKLQNLITEEDWKSHYAQKKGR